MQKDDLKRVFSFYRQATYNKCIYFIPNKSL